MPRLQKARLSTDGGGDVRTSEGAIHVGVDENGLGPRLGPLVVTAVSARATGDGAALASGAARGKLAARIGDSKKLVSFGDSALGEGWARLFAGRVAASPDDVVRALSLDPPSVLQRTCPPAHVAQCWAADAEAFGAEPALLAALEVDAERLRRSGLELLGARVVIVCAERLNESAARGVTRFETDLHAMERLVLDAREHYGQEVLATCGKVGGYNTYPGAFGLLAGRLLTTLEEGRARSSYRIAGLGTVAFVRDADATNLLVSLASLVGKWVRDLLTRRVTRYHQAVDATLPDASGYHDPVTTRFIEASALMRRARGLPDACFERRAVSSACEATSRAERQARATRRTP